MNPQFLLQFTTFCIVARRLFLFLFLTYFASLPGDYSYFSFLLILHRCQETILISLSYLFCIVARRLFLFLFLTYFASLPGDFLFLFLTYFASLPGDYSYFSFLLILHRCQETILISLSYLFCIVARRLFLFLFLTYFASLPGDYSYFSFLLILHRCQETILISLSYLFCIVARRLLISLSYLFCIVARRLFLFLFLTYFASLPGDYSYFSFLLILHRCQETILISLSSGRQSWKHRRDFKFQSARCTHCWSLKVVDFTGKGSKGTLRKLRRGLHFFPSENVNWNLQISRLWSIDFLCYLLLLLFYTTMHGTPV